MIRLVSVEPFKYTFVDDKMADLQRLSERAPDRLGFCQGEPIWTSVTMTTYMHIITGICQYT